MTRTVTDYLEETSKLYPNKIAFSDEQQSLTFGGVRESAMKIASFLVAKGLFKKPVAIYLDKCVDVPVCFIGIAYSGNFYTPIDPNMPVARVKTIFDTLQPEYVITCAAYAGRVEGICGTAGVLLLEELLQGEADESAVMACCERIIDTDLLYVFFTSGSTGTPKGVMISHRSVVDYVDWFSETFQLTKDDCLGNQAALHFDLSIQDVYAPLKCGCTTTLIKGEQFKDPGKVFEYLISRKVNVIVWIPSALCLMANSGVLDSMELPSLKMCLFCGEVMPNKQLNQWRRAFPHAVFVNMYGPTEACDASTYYIVDRKFNDDEPLPIGFPCRNTDVLLLSEEDTLVCEGETGELCLRGSSLSNGYYNDLRRTQEVFVQNPVNHSYCEMIYRTGDLAKYNERGELMYMGRKDFQIKISGYRIELGEIETAISAVPGVSSVCCLFDEEIKQIFCVYSGEIEKNIIRKQIRTALPRYMMPHKYIRLEIMPLNANGKIDRVKLKQVFIQNKGENSK